MENLTRGQLLLLIDSCRSEIERLEQQAASREATASQWHQTMRAEYDELLSRLLSRLEEAEESQPMLPRRRGTGESRSA